MLQILTFLQGLCISSLQLSATKLVSSGSEVLAEWNNSQTPTWPSWKSTPVLEKTIHFDKAFSRKLPWKLPFGLDDPWNLFFGTQDAAWDPHRRLDSAKQRYHSMNCEQHLDLALPDTCVIEKANTTIITEISTYFIGSTVPSKLKAAFPNFHFIKEVDGGDQMEVEQLVIQPFKAFQTEFLRDRPGVLGCTLAHLRAIEAAYIDNVEVALILERDALPNLAAWVSTSLENFHNSLPEGWSLAQLQWTAAAPSRAQKYKIGDANFTLGSGYGTVAYLIHRRAIESIMIGLRSSGNKFDLQGLHSACPPLTADDCLLNLGPDAHIWNRGKPLIENGTIYRANPPIFSSYDLPSTTGNTGKQFVIDSFCYDIFNAASYAAVRCSSD